MGMVDAFGRVTAQGAVYSEYAGGCWVNICINKLITRCARPQTLLALVRDVSPLMDHFNVSTCMHSLGRLSKRRASPGGSGTPFACTRLLRHARPSRALPTRSPHCHAAACRGPPRAAG